MTQAIPASTPRHTASRHTPRPRLTTQHPPPTMQTMSVRSLMHKHTKSYQSQTELFTVTGIKEVRGEIPMVDV